MIAGCIVFGVMGHLAHVTNEKDIQKVVKNGPGLTFETYPDVIAKFDFVPQLFSVLFFFMLFLLGIGTLLGIVTSVITAIHDQKPHWKRWKVVLVVAVVGFCVGLVYLTPGGLFILELMDYYGATFVTLTLAVFELLTFACIYGVDRVCKDIEFMLGIKTGMFWRICWGIVTPIVVLVILLFSIINYVPMELPSGYNGEYYFHLQFHDSIPNFNYYFQLSDGASTLWPFCSFLLGDCMRGTNNPVAIQLPDCERC